MNPTTSTVIPCKSLGMVKCPRCYHHHAVIWNFDNLCDRCQSIILENFPTHESVPFIKEALRKQEQEQPWTNRPTP